MEEVVNSVQRLASNATQIGRRNIIDRLQELCYSIETPDDTLTRLMFMHLHTAAARVGIDLKLFNLLAATDKPLTVDQLHQETGAAPVLLGRLLRYLASVGQIKEVEKDTFTSTNITKALAIPGHQAGLYHHFYTCAPLYQELPGFLAKTKYQDITDDTNTVLQVAHKSSLPAFLWFIENQKAARNFMEYMLHRRKDQATGWTYYPVEKETQGWSPDATVLVDIGGYIGHQCAEFKKKFPKVPGHVILQDLSGPIARALSTPGVENMVHDMFKPQPIKGAKFYYLRAVIHRWPDHKCREILENIIPAMGPESIILLDEMVLPDTNVHWQSTQIDLTMMAALASRGRTRTQWAEFLGSVGLEIVATRTYTAFVYKCIMTVRRRMAE